MFVQGELYNNFVNDFSNQLYNLKNDSYFSDYIFLCVGSDKVTGDTFGPIVGQHLEDLFKGKYQNIKIIGTLDEPVSAINVDTVVEKIYKEHKNPCVIAIDSALAQTKEIGKIIVSNSKMQFGKGTNRKPIAAGDISIKGVVAKDYKIPRYNFNQLQNTSLGLVMNLANVTSNGIYDVIKYR